jgi:hypothetical protein
MKTLATLALELLEEVYAVNKVNNFNNSSEYQAYTVLRLIKSSNIIGARYSFGWDDIMRFQDALELLDEGPPTKAKYEMLVNVLSTENATA